MVIAISHITDRSTTVRFSDRVMLSIGCVCVRACVSVTVPTILQKTMIFM